MESMHRQYKDKISTNTYQVLEQLLKFISSNNTVFDDKVKGKVFKNEDFNNLEKSDIRLKTKVLYSRYNILIQQLLDEYKHLTSKDRKEIIDYYLFDNRLRELNYLGLGHYYDCKFKKSSATIYKGGYREVNWPKKRQEFTGQKGVEAIQSIFKNCREHINRGGNVKLCSYSKCFGLDLFKYISLYENNLSDIYIKKNAEINIIKNADKTMSLQQFILNDISISDCDFVIDFSTPRNENRDNLNTWYNKFIGIDFKSNNKGTDSINEPTMSDWLLVLLKQAQDNQDNKQISLMVSPVSDKEVLVSGDILGDVAEYSENNLDLEKCIHFTLDENELHQLIFRYFQEYLKIKNKVSYDKFRKTYCDIINQLKQNFKSNIAEGNSEEFLKIFEKIDNIRLNILNNSKKIDSIIDLVDWEQEKISNDWSFKTIYNKASNNLLINIQKCLMFDTYNNVY